MAKTYFDNDKDKPTTPKGEKAPTPESSNCGISGYADYPTTDENPMSDTVNWWPKIVPEDKA